MKKILALCVGFLMMYFPLMALSNPIKGKKTFVFYEIAEMSSRSLVGQGESGEQAPGLIYRITGHTNQHSHYAGYTAIDFRYLPTWGADRHRAEAAKTCLDYAKIVADSDKYVLKIVGDFAPANGSTIDNGSYWNGGNDTFICSLVNTQQTIHDPSLADGKADDFTIGSPLTETSVSGVGGANFQLSDGHINVIDDVVEPGNDELDIVIEKECEDGERQCKEGPWGPGFLNTNLLNGNLKRATFSLY